MPYAGQGIDKHYKLYHEMIKADQILDGQMLRLDKTFYGNRIAH